MLSRSDHEGIVTTLNGATMGDTGRVARPGHVADRYRYSAVLIAALSCRGDAVILIDRCGVPTYRNNAAADVLARGDGLAMADGAFVTRRGPETRRLQRMIRDASMTSIGGDSHPGGTMLVTRPCGLRPYLVRAVPPPVTERFLSAHSIACVLHIHDLARVDVPTVATLGATFGLTEREGDLAIALIRCTHLHGAAQGAGMALNHLQSIFRKCGTATQAQTVQLLGRLA